MRVIYPDEPARPMDPLDPQNPTRLDPPIEIPIAVSLNRDPAHARRARRHLNRLHGWPEGVAPVEVPATAEHKEATARILGSHELRIPVTAIDAEGRMTFELARDA